MRGQNFAAHGSVSGIRVLPTRFTINVAGTWTLVVPFQVQGDFSSTRVGTGSVRRPRPLAGVAHDESLVSQYGLL